MTDNDTVKLMAQRRSVSPIAMEGPGPSPSELEAMLSLAIRVPDHGKLAPWRLIVFEGEARERAGEIISEVFAQDEPGATPDRLNVERLRLARAPLVVAVVSRAAPHVKIPEWEQIMSAGALCMNLTLAANALAIRPHGTRSGMLTIEECSAGSALQITRRSLVSFISAPPARSPRIEPGRFSAMSSHASSDWILRCSTNPQAETRPHCRTTPSRR